MPELVIGHPRTRLGLFGNRLYPTSCVQQGSVICMYLGPTNGDHYKYPVNNRNWYNLSHNNEWDPDSDIVVAQNKVSRDIYTSGRGF